MIGKYIERLNNDKRELFYLLLIVTAVKLIYITFIPITPQEAYYWYYSQNPDLSYFDHPPMAAYSILIGTTIFGDNVLGVKFMAVIWWLLTNLLLFKTAENFVQSESEMTTKSNIPLLTIILYNITVFGNLYSITMVPDTPLLFFWLLIVYSIQKALLSDKRSWWIIAGIAFGFALISKYSAIIITGSVFLYLLFSPQHRKKLLSPYPYIAIVIGVLVFSPVIYWNYAHEWASFKFQFSERAQKAKPLQLKYFFQLIFSQIFLLTPLIFIWFTTSVYKYIRNYKTKRLLDFFIYTGVPIIIIFTLVSFKSLVKMNWLLPGYLSVLIIAAYYNGNKVFENNIWIKAGFYISLFLVATGYTIQIVPNVPLGEGNTWSGWQDSAEKVFELQDDKGGRENCFIFGNSYKSASQIKFYLPDQQDTYAENIYGERALQFDYWLDVNELKGKNALYVFDNRKEYKSQLNVVEKYFDSISKEAEYSYDFFGIGKTRTISVYYCEGYHGIDK